MRSSTHLFAYVKLIWFDSYTKQTISDLLQNKVDMSQLVITKALSKTGELPEHLGAGWNLRLV